MWSKQLAVAPGARFLRGRAVKLLRAPWAVQMECRSTWRNLIQCLPKGCPSRMREDCWSRGQKVSELLGSARVECRPSLAPPISLTSVLIQRCQRAIGAMAHCTDDAAPPIMEEACLMPQSVLKFRRIGRQEGIKFLGLGACTGSDFAHQQFIQGEAPSCGQHHHCCSTDPAARAEDVEAVHHDGDRSPG